jgi:hypothetical protein
MDAPQVRTWRASPNSIESMAADEFLAIVTAPNN